MKKSLFTNLFMTIALLTSVSVFAQSADTTMVSYFDGLNSSYYKLPQEQKEQIIHYDDADLESQRECYEISRQELSAITNDKRFSERKFNFNKQ